MKKLFIVSIVLLIGTFSVYAQSPNLLRDSGSKYVYVGKHSNNGDFYSTAQLKVGTYLTLGNFGKTNQSWLGNNAILDYTSYSGNGSQGDFNKFIPVYPQGAALVMVPHYSDGSLRGFIHHWGGSSTSEIFDIEDDNQFKEVWRLAENQSFVTSSLGVGTTKPYAKLEIAGHSSDYFNALKLRNTNGAGADKTSVGIDFHHFSTPLDPNARIYEQEGPGSGNYGGDLFFATRSAGGSLGATTLQNQMVIRHNGKVGIGTDTPDEKLTVKGNAHITGTIRTTEVVVNTTAATIPDYVFKPDYQLMSLAEVESYVKANSHLPEVPSAEEVAANGHNLAEMNLILLKKIEELTLHTIRQEKELKVQKDLINKAFMVITSQQEKIDLLSKNSEK